MDATAHYRNLVTLGRQEFIASSAPAALVRRRSGVLVPGDGPTVTIDDEALDTMIGVAPVTATHPALELRDLEVYPLVKKPGASFAERITIGRTPNNDIVINDHSISRLHAYMRRDGASWVVGDAGSKNGSWLAREPLGARKERPILQRMTLRLGEVDLQFFLAADLYAALGGAG